MSNAIDHARRYVRPVLYIALLTALLIPYLTSDAEANHQPADKVVASASVDDIEFVAPEQRVLLLDETFRTSATSDLLLQISSECSITTEVMTVGSETEHARGQLKYFLTISTDGGEERPIGVTSASTSTTDPGTRGDNGNVVFCDRKYERETSFTDDEEHEIRTFMETRTANAFNWVQLNAGRGIHTVRLYATYDESETSADQDARGVVGRRTMIIEPVKMKNDEHVGDVVVD